MGLAATPGQNPDVAAPSRQPWRQSIARMGESGSMRLELGSLPEFLEVVLDSLPANIVILDEAGTIVAVNASWRRFADDNGLDWPDHGVGRDYLECGLVVGTSHNGHLTAQ